MRVLLPSVRCDVAFCHLSFILLTRSLLVNDSKSNHCENLDGYSGSFTCLSAFTHWDESKMGDVCDTKRPLSDTKKKVDQEGRHT